MDIRLPFDLGQSPRTLLQRCGYASVAGVDGEQSFTRRLGRDIYPRFHIYLKTIDGSTVCGLHLDQKKPSYPGVHAHSGEYSGDTVEREAARISGLIQNQIHNQRQQRQNPRQGLLHRLLR